MQVHCTHFSISFFATVPCITINRISHKTGSDIDLISELFFIFSQREKLRQVHKTAYPKMWGGRPSAPDNLLEVNRPEAELTARAVTRKSKLIGLLQDKGRCLRWKIAGALA